MEKAALRCLILPENPTYKGITSQIAWKQRRERNYFDINPSRTKKPKLNRRENLFGKLEFLSLILMINDRE